jgi:hypothetical protein
MSDKIVLNIVTYNRLHRFWEHVLIEKEYFDEVRIIDANSTDGTKEFCKLHELTYIPYELKTSVIQDGFSKILEYGEEGSWICYCDSDEWFSREFLRNMRRMVEESDDGNNYNIISTIPIDLMLDAPICSLYDEKAIQQKLDVPIEQAFKKEVMFKYYPGERFEGTNHQYLVGIDRRPLYVYYGYYHAKTLKEVCESCIFFTFADIVSNDLKFPKLHFSDDEIDYLKRLFETNKIDTITKFHKFWNDGNYTKEFIDFCTGCFDLPDTPNVDNGNIVSQRMAWFMYMFVYNRPNLMPEQYKGFFRDRWFYRGM